MATEEQQNNIINQLKKKETEFDYRLRLHECQAITACNFLLHTAYPIWRRQTASLIHQSQIFNARALRMFQGLPFKALCKLQPGIPGNT